MTANIDPANGIAYGFMDARNVPDLWETITAHGKDLTYEGWIEDTEAKLHGDVLSAFDAEDIPVDPDEAQDEENCREFWQDRFKHVLDCSTRQAKGLTEELWFLWERESRTFSIDEVAEACLDYLKENDYFSDDGGTPHSYDYDDGVSQYHLSGDAPPTICVLKSPYVTPCLTGSPCIMNGGDLDNARPADEANNLAYCPHPDDWATDDLPLEKWPYEIRWLATNEVLWKRKPADA